MDPEVWWQTPMPGLCGPLFLGHQRYVSPEKHNGIAHITQNQQICYVLQPYYVTNRFELGYHLKTRFGCSYNRIIGPNTHVALLPHTCVKQNGPPSRIRVESRFITSRLAPTASARSVLFMTCEHVHKRCGVVKSLTQTFLPFV